MARRSSGLGSVSGKRKVVRKVPVESLNYHEGLSVNQVKTILRESGLDYDEFDKWLYGQTCPLVERRGNNGQCCQLAGVYEYDLLRWIKGKRIGTTPIWD